MRKAPTSLSINLADFCRLSDGRTKNTGSVAVGTRDLIAVACFSFGISLAVLTPASLQNRVITFLLFGLIPAVGLCASITFQVVHGHPAGR